MDGLHICLLVLLGVVCCSDGQISGSVLEVTVRAGDNITLHCDCKLSTGVYIVWYRNCSHENQPALVFRKKLGSLKGANADASYSLRIFPRFRFVRNFSSESYDLLIENITDVDEGLYYCGTEHRKVEDQNCITIRHDYRYGNVTTRIIFNSSEPHKPETAPDCGLCWMLLFSLCPASAGLSCLLSSLVIYQLCHKKAQEPQVDQQTPEARGETRLNQDEDVCYAALEIRKPPQRPKAKKARSSDYSTYSAINTLNVQSS
ncbi:uncharacterized protein LOC121604660 [Chelmon rostratus]|uniref:uncharacterized protein LOC121604660 n=1 Tax=Chelmon rostratus TaxID=109905 RepID=UPI001BEBF6F4|nr:uncharacterized protein LOC121604660 [Chelmon rostratus]